MVNLKKFFIVFYFFLRSGLLIFGLVDPQKILILHSYQTDYPWTEDIQRGIESVYFDEPAADVIIKTEFLDTKRPWTEARQQETFQYLKTKYQSFLPDGIIVSDNDAYDFMIKHGTALFGNVPWVFCGVNTPDLAELELFRNRVTGVVEYVNYEKTIDLIKQLFPNLKTLYVLADQTSTGKLNRIEFTQVMQRLGNPLEYNYIPDGSFQDILEYVSQIPSRAALLLLAYSQDERGTYIPYKKVAGQVCASASCPVFGVWDFNVGQGILGGAMTSGFEQGREAARLLYRIFTGSNPRQLALLHLKDTPTMVDWHVLQRWRIPKNRLPAGTILINTPRNVFNENPYVGIILISLLGVILLLCVFILLIKKNKDTLRLSQIKLQEELQEKESLLREVHHRVKNNLQIIASLLHLQQTYTANPETQSVLLDTENRLRSMELVHEESYEQETFKQINLVQYLCSLGHYLSSASSNEFACIFECSSSETARELFVPLEWVVPFGLLMNELITNSIKYAHGERGFCGIYSHFDRIDATTVRLTYWDSGPGIPKEYTFDKPATLGFQLMNVLAQQCQVKLLRDEIEPSKLYILIPLP